MTRLPRIIGVVAILGVVFGTSTAAATHMSAHTAYLASGHTAVTGCQTQTLATQPMAVAGELNAVRITQIDPACIGSGVEVVVTNPAGKLRTSATAGPITDDDVVDGMTVALAAVPGAVATRVHVAITADFEPEDDPEIDPPAPPGPNAVSYYLTNTLTGTAPRYAMSLTEPASFVDRLIERNKGGIKQSNNNRHITWRFTVPAGQPLDLTGKHVKGWVWLRHHATGNKKIGLRAWVYDCPASVADNPKPGECTFVGGADEKKAQRNFSSNLGINGSIWRLAGFDFGTVGNHVVAPGRTLRFKIVAQDKVTAEHVRAGFNGTPPVNSIWGMETPPHHPSRLTVE